jgi:Zn ribbon nucleic-acid-binding protein
MGNELTIVDWFRASKILKPRRHFIFTWICPKCEANNEIKVLVSTGEETVCCKDCDEFFTLTKFTSTDVE